MRARSSSRSAVPRPSSDSAVEQLRARAVAENQRRNGRGPVEHVLEEVEKRRRPPSAGLRRRARPAAARPSPRGTSARRRTPPRARPPRLRCPRRRVARVSRRTTSARTRRSKRVESSASSLDAATSWSSDSRIPASAFTISPNAQNVIPSPYGRQRPWRQVIRSGRSSSDVRSSATSRLFPIPGSPTIVTSWTDDSRSARRNVSNSSVLLVRRARRTSLRVVNLRLARPGFSRLDRTPDRNRLRLAFRCDRVERLRT